MTTQLESVQGDLAAFYRAMAHVALRHVLEGSETPQSHTTHACTPVAPTSEIGQKCYESIRHEGVRVM